MGWVTVNEPVIFWFPITVNSVTADDEIIKDPVIIWFPTNVFEPVVAKDEVWLVSKTLVPFENIETSYF